jgi:hypothetical protein
VITHCRSALEIRNAACADGSAMLTIVVSRTTINWARAMQTSAIQRRRFAAGATGPMARSET